VAAAIELPTIDARLALAEVYDKVDTVISHAS